MKKLFKFAVVVAVLFLAYTMSEITNIPHHSNQAYAVIIDPSTGEEIKMPVETIPPASTFPRGTTKDADIPWYDMECRNQRTGEYYESDILSFDEVEYNLRDVGFTPENAHIMAAIAHQESGHQLQCIGDEPLTTDKWTYSYGIFQIRGLNSETGKGSCRDIQSLGIDIHRQAECAFEISGGGKNFRPWTMYLNGEYKESL